MQFKLGTYLIVLLILVYTEASATAQSTHTNWEMTFERDGKAFVGDYTFIPSAVLPTFGKSGYTLFNCKGKNGEKGWAFSGDYKIVSQTPEMQVIRIWWYDNTGKLAFTEDINASLSVSKLTIQGTDPKGNKLNTNHSAFRSTQLQGAWGRLVAEYASKVRQGETKTVLDQINRLFDENVIPQY